MSATVCFVDTETTSLDPETGEIWEVGLIVRKPITASGHTVDVEHHWFLPVDLGRADPRSLEIGGFHDRHPHGYRFPEGDRDEGRYARKGGAAGLPEFAAQFAQLTDGAHLVGAVVSFDEERLRKLLRRNGACPSWHYHIVDIEAMGVGALCAKGLVSSALLPWDSKELSLTLGVDPEDYDVHTALGDARWARDLWDKVVSGG